MINICSVCNNHFGIGYQGWYTEPLFSYTGIAIMVTIVSVVRLQPLPVLNIIFKVMICNI